MFHRPRSCPSLTRFPQDARIGRRRPGDELSQLSPPSPFHCVSPYIMHYTAFAGNKESLASLYGLQVCRSRHRAAGMSMEFRLPIGGNAYLVEADGVCDCENV